jgi:glycogen(starch) synthase
MPEIVFVSRELHPITRGGIGTHIHGVATALAHVADVTVITHTLNEPGYRELAARDDPLLPSGVRFEFVPDPTPDDRGSFYNLMHAYSARIYEKLRELYPVRGPDLIEFPDYLGEGLVTLQAHQTHAPFLRDTRVCVRLHTSLEMIRVLNGHLGDDVETRALFEAERHTLAAADRVIWQGGDILETYRRFYGPAGLADAVQIANARASIAQAVGGQGAPPADGPMRFLYINRLERRKGVENLIRAATSLARDDWALTLVGGDSDTAPLGGSMREHLEVLAAGDPRIEFHPPRQREELADAYAGHHVLLCPSLWECWPYVVLEALEAGRPVLGTRTGGLVAMLSKPGAGWLVDGRDPTGLADALADRLDQRESIHELIRSGAPRRAHRTLTDDDDLRQRYLELARDERPPSTAPRSRMPLVSVVIPYFRLHEFIEETVASACAQDYPSLEVVVVNDGSFWAEDSVLFDLAERYPVRVLTTANSGLGAARNAGVRQSTGRYVFPLDADDVVAADFVRRCVEVLESEPEVAYVTSWSKYVDEDGEPYLGSDDGYRPIGNSLPLTLRVNVAGSAAAVIRKRVFELGHWYRTDLTSYEDWQLYRELHVAGLYGRVIPEPLLTYRIRTSSMLRQRGMPQHERLLSEMDAYLVESQMEWECQSA